MPGFGTGLGVMLEPRWSWSTTRSRDRQREEDKRQSAENERRIAENKQMTAETVTAIDEYRRTVWRYAKRMRDDGVPCAEISQETGLTVEEIDSM